MDYDNGEKAELDLAVQSKPARERIIVDGE